MRKYLISRIAVLLLLSITVIFFSCSKESTRIRVFNADIASFDDVKVGPCDFGYVLSEKMTGYKGITEGNHQVTWSFHALDYSKNINIPEQGDYTLKIIQFECELMKD